jgi:hypothetical protein
LCTTGDPVSVATDEEGTNDEDKVSTPKEGTVEEVSGLK